MTLSCLYKSFHLSSFFRKMSGQAKISTFFSPAAGGGKRKLSVSQESGTGLNGGDNTNANCHYKQDSPEKRKKLESTCTDAKDNQENIPSTPPSSNQESLAQTPKQKQACDEDAPTLSPEQKGRIEENRMMAKIKLAEKTSHGLIVNIGPTWFKALEPEFSKPYFLQLSKFVSEQRKANTIYPPADQVFSWTKFFPIREVKVVILGQDPYHGPNQAHGLCFSVQKGIPPPPSLVNMYKELTNDIEGFKHPGHGYLCGWSTQGVLLLNACLTVKARNANSHAGKGWEKFTDAVIGWINKNTAGTVFLLWGSYAQKKGICIDKKKHHVLKGVHPSPLSAHRGFFGCKHFSECNKLLRQQGKKPINWCHLPAPK